ncbi:MAG: tRNA-binding protein [Candidatus Nanohaloarchaea archaeon]
MNPLENEIKVGTVEKAEKFEEARKPEMFRLEIDLGGRKVKSAAQLGYHHEPAEVEGEQVLCVTDLDPVRIAGFKSEVLTVGVPGEDGNPVLVKPEKEVPDGGNLY